jgi:hypothetical protein
MKIDGGCYCGYLTFEGEADPDKTTICHCTDCQALTGTAFRVNVGIPDSTFRMLSGEPTTFIKTGSSGAKRQQGFCPKCGTPIYSTAPGDGPKVYIVRVGTLRQRDKFVPKVQNWSRSRQPWVTELGSVRAVEQQQ